jgi:hypothetical protein
MDKEIDITLTAKNSSGEQKLHLNREDSEYWFTLTGRHDGRYLQIDFNTMGRSELIDLRTAIDLILEE